MASKTPDIKANRRFFIIIKIRFNKNTHIEVNKCAKHRHFTLVIYICPFRFSIRVQYLSLAMRCQK
ncbi:hypothetical protein D3C86_1228500 [compost metagenome]